MDEEFDLRQLGAIIKKHGLLIVAIPLIAAFASGIINFYILQPVYQASTTLIVGKKASGDALQADQLLAYQVLVANQQLAKTYGTMAKSRGVEEKVINELALPLTPEQLDSRVSVTSIKDTEILKISVTDTDPERATEITNSMAKNFSEFVIQIKKVDSVSIIDSAIVPKQPIKPNKMKNILITYVFGLMAAIGISFLFEFLDNTLKTSKEVKDILDLSVLGRIPLYKKEDVTLYQPKSAVAEAFRTLRTNLLFCNVDDRLRTVLFTSAGPGEGKSSTIANLGIAMAQAGKRVLIIDADLRRPCQHQIFKRGNAEGLSTSLVNELACLAQIQGSQEENLDILTAGPIPPNPADMLGSMRMRQLLTEAAAAYDFVLIDTPPTISVADSSILAQLVDGSVIVLGSGEVKRDYAVQAKEQLLKVGAKIIGGVLNKVDIDSKDQYYYSSYYGAERKRFWGLRNIANKTIRF